MKSIKKTIGVLDMNIDNMYVLNAIRNTFINDDIYYVNDTEVETFDEMDTSDIAKHVSKHINYLLSKNIDILVVVSDSIVEYCEELLNQVEVPVINIINETIEYVNENYEYKNFGFLSTTTMIESNIYQKSFRYNHLYSMNGDKLKFLIRNQLVKTTETFQESKNIIAPVYKKDLDVIIPSLVNFLMVKTEINEFLKDVDIVDVDEVLVNKIQEVLYKDIELPKKGKGKTFICVNQEENDLSQLKRLLKIKYKVLNILEEEANN